MSEPEAAAPRGVTSAQLAGLFDCTTRHVELLANKGIAIKLGHGRYDAPQSTRNYIRHLREQAAARVGSDPERDGVAANVKHKDASTRLLELRIQREARELVPVAAVREAWGAIVRQIRQFVLGLPGQIQFAVPTLSRHDRNIVERLIRDGLEDAALARGFAVADDSHGSDQSAGQGSAGAPAAAAAS